MAKRKIKYTEQPAEIEVFEVRNRYNLESGDKVRFRLQEGQSWIQATVMGEHKDGSLHLYDPRMGHSRAIMPEKVQRKKTGPRGGVLWEDLA